jgi:hypothetical protein
MLLRGKKLGVLLSSSPSQPGFQHGLALSQTALAAGVDVYLYCIDEAVRGLEDTRLREMAGQGLKLFACAYSSDQRRLPRPSHAIFSGLAALSELMAATDRFVSFNA